MEKIYEKWTEGKTPEEISSKRIIFTKLLIWTGRKLNQLTEAKPNGLGKRIVKVPRNRGRLRTLAAC